MQFVCVNPICGFRAGERYYADKERFHRFVCPVCNAPVQVVEDDTNDELADCVLDRATGLVKPPPGGGALMQVSIAAATAVVNYDILSTAIFRTDGRPRRIVAAGLAGSAAALDTIVRLMVGSNQVATMYNTSTGAPNRDDMFRVGEAVPSNTPIHAYIVDAPSTNPINMALDLI